MDSNNSDLFTNFSFLWLKYLVEFTLLVEIHLQNWETSSNRMDSIKVLN